MLHGRRAGAFPHSPGAIVIGGTVYDDERLAADPLLASLDDADRATLIASRMPDGGLHFDIRLQGVNETVFLTY